MLNVTTHDTKLCSLNCTHHECNNVINIHINNLNHDCKIQFNLNNTFIHGTIDNCEDFHDDYCHHISEEILECNSNIIHFICANPDSNTYSYESYFPSYHFTPPSPPPLPLPFSSHAPQHLPPSPSPPPLNNPLHDTIWINPQSRSYPPSPLDQISNINGFRGNGRVSFPSPPSPPEIILSSISKNYKVIRNDHFLLYNVMFGVAVFLILCLIIFIIYNIIDLKCKSKKKNNTNSTIELDILSI